MKTIKSLFRNRDNIVGSILATLTELDRKDERGEIHYDSEEQRSTLRRKINIIRRGVVGAL